jgi:hypothetical protein
MLRGNFVGSPPWHCRACEYEVQTDTEAKLIQRVYDLEAHTREMLHWIYPREGDWDKYRAAEFVIEAMVGYLLIREPHPMANPQKIVDAALSLLRKDDGRLAANRPEVLS